MIQFTTYGLSPQNFYITVLTHNRKIITNFT